MSRQKDDSITKNHRLKRASTDNPDRTEGTALLGCLFQDEQALVGGENSSIHHPSRIWNEKRPARRVPFHLAHHGQRTWQMVSGLMASVACVTPMLPIAPL